MDFFFADTRIHKIWITNKVAQCRAGQGRRTDQRSEISLPFSAHPPRIQLYYIAQANERKQVEGHMRVCLKIDAAFENMITVSASEPLLSEAAYSMMAQTSFNVQKAMKSVLEGFSTFLSGGLFQHLPSLQSLHQDFPDSKMHVNHYVEVHEYAAIDAESLLLLSSQRAGILCANMQYAIDGINPFLFHGTALGFGNLGLILWQGKNDPAFTATSQSSVFEAIDVYKLKILKEGDPTVPLIKIVFVLAARSSSLTVVRHPPSITMPSFTKYGVQEYLLTFSMLLNHRRRTLGLHCFRLKDTRKINITYLAIKGKQHQLKKSPEERKSSMHHIIWELCQISHYSTFHIICEWLSC